MALCASSDLIGVAQLADHARRRINGGRCPYAAGPGTAPAQLPLLAVTLSISRASAVKRR